MECQRKRSLWYANLLMYGTPAKLSLTINELVAVAGENYFTTAGLLAENCHIPKPNVEILTISWRSQAGEPVSLSYDQIW